MKEKVEELRNGEAYYIARVKLVLNYGKLKIEPGVVVILGPADEAQGIRIANLVKCGAVVPYESKAQVKAIRKKWNEEGKPRREALKATARSSRRR